MKAGPVQARQADILRALSVLGTPATVESIADVLAEAGRPQERHVLTKRLLDMAAGDQPSVRSTGRGRPVTLWDLTAAGTSRAIALEPIR